MRITSRLYEEENDLLNTVPKVLFRNPARSNQTFGTFNIIPSQIVDLLVDPVAQYGRTCFSNPPAG